MNEAWRAFLVLTVCGIAACGRWSGGADVESSALACSSAAAMPASLETIWERTEECTGLSAPRPRVALTPAAVCPQLGTPDCLSDASFSSCDEHPLLTCGVVGRFLSECDAIELPESSTFGAAHEMIHHLKRANGHRDWAEHTGPEWACECPRD